MAKYWGWQRPSEAPLGGGLAGEEALMCAVWIQFFEIPLSANPAIFFKWTKPKEAENLHVV